MQQPPAESDLKWEYYRATGPGGQHRNKVETAVRLTHLPTGITVQASERRSREQNRAQALERLMRRLEEMRRPVKPRRPTKPSKASREKRLKAKRQRSVVKSARNRPTREDW